MAMSGTISPQFKNSLNSESVGMVVVARSLVDTPMTDRLHARKSGEQLRQSGEPYTEYTFTETASASVTRLQFGGYNAATSGVFNLDDVSVTTSSVPEPSSIALLRIFGAAGLLGWR